MKPKILHLPGGRYLVRYINDETVHIKDVNKIKYIMSEIANSSDIRHIASKMLCHILLKLKYNILLSRLNYYVCQVILRLL